MAFNDMEKLLLCFFDDSDIINTIYTISFDNKDYFAHISRQADCDTLTFEITAKPYNKENPKITISFESYMVANLLMHFVGNQHFLYKFMQSQQDTNHIDSVYENLKSIIEACDNTLLKSIMLRSVLENSLEDHANKPKRVKI